MKTSSKKFRSDAAPPYARGFYRPSKTLLSLAISAILFHGDLTAQTPDKPKKGKQITEVMVEGKAIDENISEFAFDVAKFGTQVQSIDADEIETGGFTNFGELAAGLIRGANIGYSPDEGEFTIRIDGGTDRDTLLMVDGVPTFDRGTPLETLWGATAVDPRMIDSVEIFRGGQSLYFGGNGGLGVVNVRYKKPEVGEGVNGEIGFYGGSFNTREMYGNVALPLTDNNDHYLMFFGRSYETDAHEMFDTDAYVDNVLALGGKHEFPYTYNLLGAKYLWAIDAETELRLSYQLATIDFRDSFPNRTIFQPNYTAFPMFDVKFKTRFTDRLSFELDGYYTAPTLKNSEVDAQLCQIPDVDDLPAEFRKVPGTEPGTVVTRPAFANAAEFESFAAQNGLPAGCVTNPSNALGLAAAGAGSGFYADDNGDTYGTIDNPFPIGAPMGFVIQSTSSFDGRPPTKGFGGDSQYTAGYIDYGLNTRLKMEWNEHFETVTGVQSVNYKDNSASVYGLRDDVISSTGIYNDFRVSADFLEGTNFSLALRQDFNSKFDDQSIWKFGLRQNLPRGVYFRANGGTSYSNPTTSEAGMRRNSEINPGLEPQQVETYSTGVGINGNALGGTYNIELGYFDTVIDNFFGNGPIERTCPDYEPFLGSPNLADEIVIPEEFCRYAIANELSGNTNVSYNRKGEQAIEGITLDIALDLEKWQLDFTFTDMESLEENSLFGAPARRAGTGEVLDFIIPGAAGNSEFRQSSERPEWSASALLTFTPTERWVFSLNPKWQGPEWAYAGRDASSLVDENGTRTNPDLNFGDYMVMNGSIQYLLGDNLQHRFLLRAVNILDEDYYERASNPDRRYSRAGARKEIGKYDPEYHYQYGWNGKPRSFWLQYEYVF